jgi:flagellum-specific peptidoglycan hydrolase FlgJ
MRTLFTFFTLILFVQIAAANTPTNLEIAEYIDQYDDIAIQEMKRSGIPASIILAQAIYSSEYGTNTAAIDNNNHFATKCGIGWEGDTQFANAENDISATCFRAYADAAASFIDYTNILMEEATCRPLFRYSYYDYKSWANGLQKCVYNNDKKYADKLIKIIKKYSLSKLDNPNSFSPPTQQKPIIGYEFEID